MMKNRFFWAAISLTMLVLAACQAAPAPTNAPVPTQPAVASGDTATGGIIGFFKDDPQRSLTVALPKGWVAKLGGEDARSPIVVTDDWLKYQNKALDREALGIIVSPLTDKGAPDQILNVVAGRLGEMLTSRQGEITTTQQGDQQIAWAEYAGKSVEDGSPVQFLLAVIVKGQRSVFVFTSVLPERVESVRPKYQEVVNGVTLR